MMPREQSRNLGLSVLAAAAIARAACVLQQSVCVCMSWNSHSDGPLSQSLSLNLMHEHLGIFAGPTRYPSRTNAIFFS